MRMAGLPLLVRAPRGPARRPAPLLLLLAPLLAPAAARPTGRVHVGLSASGEAEPGPAAALAAPPPEAPAGSLRLAVVDASGSVATQAAAAAARAREVPELRQAVNGSTPTGDIRLGTPAVALQVIFDTGSDRLVAKTWDTLKRELRAVDKSAGNSVRPSAGIYDHNSSKTYVRQYTFVDGKKRPRRGFIAYGSGIAITDEGSDTVLVGGNRLKNFTVSEIMADSLAVLHSKRGVSGVLGLQHMKNRSMGESVYSRCRDLGFMSTFGYCRGRHNNGTFIWGDRATDGTALSVLGQIHWAVRLSGLALGKQNGTSGAKPAEKMDEERGGSAGGERVLARQFNVDTGFVDRYAAAKYSAAESLSEGTSAGAGAGGAAGIQESRAAPAPVCSDGKCMAIIDTGSNIIAGPSAVLLDIKKQLGVKADCSNLAELRHIEFSLGGFQVSLPPSAYVMKIKLPSFKIPLHHTHPNRHKHKRFISLGSFGPLHGPAPAAGSAAANASLRALRDEAFQDLHARYGLDLAPALEEVPLDTLLSGTRFCMPAFVPLDKKTKLGPLWVVGTPLFDKYYVRWSWPKGDESPKIFIQDLKTASACKPQGGRAPSAPATVAAAVAARGPGLVRSEPRASRSETHREAPADAGGEAAEDPTIPEREAAEIRYPHWAREISDL